MDGFSLGDFVGTLGEGYTSYINASGAADVAKINQQSAATTAAAAATVAASNAQLKTYAIYGAIALGALLLVAVVVKMLRK